MPELRTFLRHSQTRNGENFRATQFLFAVAAFLPWNIVLWEEKEKVQVDVPSTVHFFKFLSVERKATMSMRSAKLWSWITQNMPWQIYSDVKNYSCMFEISCLSAARQLGQPMHSQSANFIKFKLNSQNLAGIFLHNSVYLEWMVNGEW